MALGSRRDLYALLGVPRNASTAQIRSAYRRKAHALHPDKNPLDPTAEEELKRVNRAFEVLGNGELRRRYDEFGEAGLREGFDPDVMRQYRNWRPPGVRAGGWSGNIGTIFGGGRAAPPPAFGEEDVDAFYRAVVDRTGERAIGADVERVVEVTLGEALRGAEKQIDTGIYGVGAVRVRLPRGIRDGERVRVRGRGEPGRGGGTPGDLLLRIRIAPNAAFRLEGDDLVARVPITVGEAWRGTTLTVPTPLGPRDVVIPPGTGSGAELVVPGAGAPLRAGGQGDLRVEIDVRLPPSGAREVRSLMDALDRLYAARLRDDLEL